MAGAASGEDAASNGPGGLTQIVRLVAQDSEMQRNFMGISTEIYSRCIETMANVCETNAKIYKKMLESGEWTEYQLEIARNLCEKSKTVLKSLILKYLTEL